MEPLGIMLYGYDQEHALMIKASLESVLEQDIVLLSASRREDVEVRDILEAICAEALLGQISTEWAAEKFRIQAEAVLSRE